MNGDDARVWYRVVGVVPEVRLESLDRAPTEAVFYPASGLRPDERGEWLTGMSYIVRTPGRDPLALVPQVRALAKEVDARIPVVSPRTLATVAARSTARTSFTLALLGLAGTLGLLLSAVGLYGVVSYVVLQRRGEIGLRLALGATPQDVLGLVIGQSVRLGALGVVLGVAGALVTNRALEAMLFGVRAMDPVVLAGVAGVLMATVLAASWAPAVRAARVAPTEAMRG